VSGGIFVNPARFFARQWFCVLDAEFTIETEAEAHFPKRLQNQIAVFFNGDFTNPCKITLPRDQAFMHVKSWSATCDIGSAFWNGRSRAAKSSRVGEGTKTRTKLSLKRPVKQHLTSP